MMDKAAVEEVISEAGTNKAARIALAKAALSRTNLAEDGRSAWAAYLAELIV